MSAGRSMTSVLVLLSALASTTMAHNWVNSPSRSEFASTVNPALPSQTGLPHARVLANQDVQVEWVNGHDSDCYWILTAEKDSFKNLLKMSTTALEDYINNAPADQNVSPPPRWQKYHRKYNSANNDNKAGDAFFQSVIKPADGNANYLARPDTFEGRFSGAPGGNGATANASLVFQAVYFQNTSCAMNDRRVAYPNPKYPFVIAVHRYRLCTGQANRPDVARLTFPAGTAAGRYVAQWQWRGYYDIVDIEIVAGSTPVVKPYGNKVPAPPAGVPAQYKRVDHCAFPEATPAGKCFRILSDARACLDMCDRLTEFACQGVAIVPVVYPSGAYQGFKNISFMPYEFASNCRKTDIERGATAGHVACFAATARPKTDTVDRIYVTHDPEDPAFYSTCMLRIPYQATAAGPVPVPPRDEDWSFGKKCISCRDAKISTYEQAIMVWNTTTTCANCDVDGVARLPAAVIPKAYNQSETPWVERFPNKYCNGLNNGANFSRNYVCPNATTSCVIGLRPPGAVNADVSEFDCYTLAKADPRCGKSVFKRKVNDENPSECWCWRGDGGDTACCGVCDVVNSNAMMLYSK
jgi:hypothetical protein